MKNNRKTMIFMIGLIVHSNWPNMSMWRFQASATLALVALLPVFFASNEAIQMTRKNTSLYETKYDPLLLFLWFMTDENTMSCEKGGKMI